MTDDSSPELRTKSLLEKNLYKLTNRFEGLEENLERLDCFLFESGVNQEEDRVKIQKLEKRVTELEVEFEKTGVLEERVSVLKVQNVELREHLNLTINMLNNVVKILNNQFINEESADEATEVITPPTTPEDTQDENTQHTLRKVCAMYEVTTPHEDMDEDTQPTLAQVYAMYQSQPLDEEGWDEMTAAIEAAEEYEARKKVNGLTANEWQDLLQLK